MLSAIAGVAWALLPIPIDLVLWSSQSSIIQYALIVETLQSVVIGWLVWVLLGRRFVQPWPCPVCKGRGRVITELIAADRRDVDQFRKMFERCQSCDGKGFVPWNPWQHSEEE